MVVSAARYGQLSLAYYYLILLTINCRTILLPAATHHPPPTRDQRPITMTTNAIDFRELRRQERQRVRNRNGNAKSNDCVCVGNVGIGISAITTPINPSPTQHDNYKATDPNEHGINLQQNQTIGHAYRIISRPVIDSIFYVQNFLPSNNEREILTWLTSLPEHSPQLANGAVRQSEREESIQHNGKWTRLKHARRKVALFDGTLCRFHPILQSLSNTLVEVGAFPSTHPPNHVLVNEYQPGEGIMPHTDGPAYESRTATISLGGSDVIFKLWPRNQHRSDALDDNTTTPHPETNLIPSLEVILHGHGSLILFTNDAYLNHCHEISEGILEEVTNSNGICGNDPEGGTLVTRGHRISLTFRHKKQSPLSI